MLSSVHMLILAVRIIFKPFVISPILEAMWADIELALTGQRDSWHSMTPTQARFQY